MPIKELLVVVLVMTIGWSYVRMEQVYRFYCCHDPKSVIVEEFEYCLPRTCQRNNHESRYLPFDR